MLENAAKPTRSPWYLNIGIPELTASVASDGTTDRIAARTSFKLRRAGSATRERYSSTLLGVACFFMPLKQQDDSLLVCSPGTGRPYDSESCRWLKLRR